MEYVDPSPETPRERRTHGPVLPGLLVAVLVAGLLVLRDPGATGARLRELFGMQGRLGEAVQVEDGPGAYKFFRLQDDSDEPTTWSPCRPIHYVVNPAGAPPQWEQVVTESVGRISAATGFRFSYDGLTDVRDFDRTGGYGPSRDQPVLIGWSDEEETPALAGDVAGIGGSAWVRRDIGRAWFTTDVIALDTDVFDRLAATGSTADVVEMEAIVTHELGHVMGLDHVDDPRELMYGGHLQRTSLGAGDRRGLAILGSVPC